MKKYYTYEQVVDILQRRFPRIWRTIFEEFL